MTNGTTGRGLPNGRPYCAVTLTASPAAACAARAYVKLTLETWGLTRLTENAVLTVSELVTNAICHASDLLTLECFRDDGRLVVQVWDPSGEVPELIHAEPGDIHGRGLVIVEALADGWGTRLAEGTKGKVVWAAFDVRSGIPVRPTS